MYYKFLKYIEQKKLFAGSDNILLAISGGRDSMTMLQLFKSAGFNFAVAHFNHKTRNGGSDLDEEFVKDFCSKIDVNFYSTAVDIKSLLKKGQGNNFQDLARKYRYEWLEEIRKDHKFNYIATAHNQDDNIETFIYKLIKGSGTKGIEGIKPKSGNIIRPLLDVTRLEIDRYISDNRIHFVEDSSNNETDYNRNFIRHKIIPLFRQLHPKFDQRIMVSIRNIISNNELLSFVLAEFTKPYIQRKKDHTLIEKKMLALYDHPEDLLFSIISMYGFNHHQCSDVVKSIGNYGARFESDNYMLLNEREKLIICAKNELSDLYLEISGPGSYKTEYGTVIIEEFPNRQGLDFNSNIKFVNCDMIQFPMIIRTRRSGDTFSPFGLKGKTQKVKKYLREKKISGYEMDRTLLMESGGQIFIVLGIEISYNVRVTDECGKVLSIAVK